MGKSEFLTEHSQIVVDQNHKIRRKPEFGYYYTNDRGLVTAYFDAFELKHSLTSGGMMLAVGTGGVISMLPEIQQAGIETVLFVDKDPNILIWTQKQVDTINSNLRSKLIELNSSVKTIQTSIFGDPLLQEFKILGKYHVLNKPLLQTSRFEKTRRALSKIQIFYSCADLSDKKAMSRLGKELSGRNLKITLANLTNIFEFEGKSHSGLKKLPIVKDTVIMWSGPEPYSGEMCSQKPVIGLEKYFKLAAENISEMSGIIM